MSTWSLKSVFHFACVWSVIVLLSISNAAFSQIYRWEDEKGTVHVTDDPSAIPEKYRSNPEKPKETLPKSPFGMNRTLPDDLEKSSESRLTERNETQRPPRIDVRKLVNNLVYLVGLLIILAVITKILIGLKPVRAKRPIPPRRPALSARTLTEFKVYTRDYIDDSMVFLGMIRERRKRERGDNFGDLLRKARKDFSDRVSDPTTIFLLGL